MFVRIGLCAGPLCLQFLRVLPAAAHLDCEPGHVLDSLWPHAHGQCGIPDPQLPQYRPGSLPTLTLWLSDFTERFFPMPDDTLFLAMYM